MLARVLRMLRLLRHFKVTLNTQETGKRVRGACKGRKGSGGREHEGQGACRGGSCRDGSAKLPSSSSSIRLSFCVTARHLPSLQGIQMLLSTLIISLPAIVNVGALLCLLFFVFAYIGEGAGMDGFGLLGCSAKAVDFQVGWPGACHVSPDALMIISPLLCSLPTHLCIQPTTQACCSLGVWRGSRT